MEEEDLHTLLKNGFQDHMPVDSSNKGNQSITEFGNYAGFGISWILWRPENYKQISKSRA